MKKERTYYDQIHFEGRIWIISAIVLLLMVPVVISIYYNAWPNLSAFVKGLLSVIMIFWPVGIIEVFTYAPMIGAGGSYLAFITGNITNLKAPCVINAMEITNTKPGTEEGEIISTIAIAVSSIVTTIIIAAGALLITQLKPILELPVLKPAFDGILPALFGGLAVVFVSKNWKIAIAPLVVMLLLFILLPSFANSGTVGILVPVGVLVAIGASRILYKLNWV